jgi:ketosteroid isomerase-like protein
MDDQAIRAVLGRHWAATEAADYDVEHEIYRDDVVLEYPQSGEHIRGRANIQASRSLHPARRRFEVQRVFGSGDLWVTEYVITYDERAYYTVSVMEFREGKVVRETQYFADPFKPPEWRSRWVE